jgi:hypothetical protein
MGFADLTPPSAGAVDPVQQPDDLPLHLPHRKGFENG